MSTSKASVPPQGRRFSRDDLENSSLAQLLSQRLTNMEQQLYLLKDDLKKATGTLREKDREILTLQNRIALAERRRELEEAGLPVDESLKDEATDFATKSRSKRDVLTNEVATLAQKLEEMEKFFGDYGLVWIKEDALDEKDPNSLWVRKSNIHYTPDFDKVFLVVEELNLGNAGPQIVRKGNTAEFKMAQLLNLTLYADGIQLENNPFRKYDSPSVEEFFRDLEDGYFPTELKGDHPEGVIFKVKDKRTINFADDPDKRPVLPQGTKSVDKRASSSVPTSLDSLKMAAKKSAPVCRPGPTDGQKRSTKGSGASSGIEASSSKRRNSLKKTPSRPSKGVAAADSSARKSDGPPAVPPGSAGDVTVPTKLDPHSEGTPATKETADAGDAKQPEPSGPLDKPSGGAISPPASQIGGGAISGDVPGVAPPSAEPASSTQDPVLPGPSNQEGTDPGKDFKELFRGSSPGHSAQRLDHHSGEAQPKDGFGLPRPPFPSTSNTTTDVRPLPLGPPSKQFNNFTFPKTSQTQTSLTLMPGIKPTYQPSLPQPDQTPPPPPPTTHVTNITYNEAPITIQMTPSEVKGRKDGAVPPVIPTSCPVHHPHPCNCAKQPCEPCAHQEEPKEEPLGLRAILHGKCMFSAVKLTKVHGETEYREKFTESAINNEKVLEFKKKSYERSSHSPSPMPVPRQPAATLLVGPNEAPIPPDPIVPVNVIDPNVKWQHFTYMGHPKGQEPVASPEAAVESSPKRKHSAKVIQLNEKTSDRMVAVRMRTKSGSKEFLAHLYPDDPVSKVWSLLKLNDQSHLLSTEDDTVISSESPIGVAADQVLRIISSKNEDNVVKAPPEFPEFTRKDPEIFKTSEDGKKKRTVKKSIVRQHKTDARTLQDHIDEVKLMMKEDENDDDESGSMLISPHQNRNWITRERYEKLPVARVPSKELHLMLERFKNQELSTPRPNVAVEQTGHLSGAVTDAPYIQDDNKSIVPAEPKPSRSSKTLKIKQADVIDRSSSSEVDAGSYFPEPRQKVKIENLTEPPSDYPTSVSDIDLPSETPDGSSDFTEKSNHSLIFKRQTCSTDTTSQTRRSHKNRKDTRQKRSGKSNSEVGSARSRSSHKTRTSRTRLKRSSSKKSSHRGTRTSQNKKASDKSRRDLNPPQDPTPDPNQDGSSRIGHHGFDKATLLDIVRAMQEAKQDGEQFRSQPVEGDIRER